MSPAEIGPSATDAVPRFVIVSDATNPFSGFTRP